MGVAQGNARQLAAIARRQHRLFTRDQALACGYSADYRRRRVRDGTWTEVERGILRPALAGDLTWQERLMALVLATGGVAAGRSAGALFGLLPPPQSAEVVVERRVWSRRHRRPGVGAVLDLTERDIVRVDHIPATTVARTLVDLAGSTARPLATDLVDTAIVRGLVTPRRLAERATTLWSPRRRGCAVVLELLASAHPELWRARNDWEARVLRHLDSVGARRPVVNHVVVVGDARRIIDFAWSEPLVALEFDGFVPHSNRSTFDDDRERQNDLVDAGWKVFRITSTAIRRSARRALAPVLRAIGG